MTIESLILESVDTIIFFGDHTTRNLSQIEVAPSRRARNGNASGGHLSEKIDIRIAISKRDDAKRIITGWAAVSEDKHGSPVIDHQGDFIPVDELEKAAQQLMSEGGVGRAGEMHEKRVGDITEMAVLTPEKLRKLGFTDTNGPSGLVVSMKILDDSAWGQVVSGKLSELSISGTGERIPIDG